MQREVIRRIGLRVKQLREERGWTKGELAYHAKVSRPYVSQLEAGKMAGRKPSLAHLAGVAGALGEDPWEWLRQVNPSFPATLAELKAQLEPDVIEVALLLQSMPPGVRQDTIRIFRSITAAVDSQAQRRVAEEREEYKP